MKSLATISFFLLMALGTMSQCSNYTFTFGGGTWDSEITWNITNAGGTVLATGAAASAVTLCLDYGCYTINMFDSFGDGWNGASYVITDSGGIPLTSGTLDTADSGDGVSFGSSVECLAAPVPCNDTEYIFSVGGGTFDSEISWAFSYDAGTQIANGGAPTTVVLCIPDGCYNVLMLDSFGDGWNGASWTLTTTGGAVVGSGTMGGGASTLAYVEVGTGFCDVTYPSQDCLGAVTICDDQTFGGNSEGSGIVDELSAANAGCLAFENQTSWFIFSPTTTGTIEFTLTPSNGIDYDFAIWGPYDEVSCPPQQPPLRCSWSGLYAPTGLEVNTAEGDVSEGAGGDAWVEAITITAAEVDMLYIMLIDNWTADNTSFSLDWDLTGVVLNCQIMLPVDFLSFDGTPYDTYNLLEWTTASEVGAAYYEIERSQDLVNWSAIGYELASGFSQQVQHYSFRDLDRGNTTQYYRLKQYDTNGHFFYSETRAINPFEDLAIGKIYPNPSDDAFRVNVNSAVGNLNLNYFIYDNSGRLIQSSNLITVSGSSSYLIPTSSLTNGSYVFSIRNSEGTILEHAHFAVDHSSE